MKTLIATLLATAAGASFAAAPTAALNHDPATYRNVNQKALTDYRTAVAKCDSMSGNDKSACKAEAKYALDKSKCDAKTGADKDSCMSSIKSVHTASTTTTTAGVVSTAAVDKCAQAGGDSKTGCLVETKPSAVRDTAAAVANRTGNAAENAADNTRTAASTAASKTRDAAATAAEKTKAVAATAAEKTKEVAHTAVEKTKQAASTVAQKTETAVDRAGADTRQAAVVSTDKTADAGARTQVAASDTAITTKVKAGLVNVPNLDSLGVHVETQKGVVMLSGFVDSKAQADQAVQVAKGVDGVSSVKSAIKVK